MSCSTRVFVVSCFFCSLFASVLKRRCTTEATSFLLAFCGTKHLGMVLSNGHVPMSSFLIAQLSAYTLLSFESPKTEEHQRNHSWQLAWVFKRKGRTLSWYTWSARLKDLQGQDKKEETLPSRSVAHALMLQNAWISQRQTMLSCFTSVKLWERWRGGEERRTFHSLHVIKGKYISRIRYNMTLLKSRNFILTWSGFPTSRVNLSPSCEDSEVVRGCHCHSCWLLWSFLFLQLQSRLNFFEKSAYSCHVWTGKPRTTLRRWTVKCLNCQWTWPADKVVVLEVLAEALALLILLAT